MITGYEDIKEYEDEYRVYYIDRKLNKKYEDVIASSKEVAYNIVKSMKGLNIGYITSVKALTKTGQKINQYKSTVVTGEF